MSKTETAAAVLGSGVALFVRRPILAFVLSALIVLSGIAALFGVEIRELPNVDRPVITITTEFSGASPESVDQDVTSRIEGAVGRVAGVCVGGAGHGGGLQVAVPTRASGGVWGSGWSWGR